jgi:hypothetical protein
VTQAAPTVHAHSMPQPPFHRPEFEYTHEFIDALARIDPDPVRQQTLADAVEWALIHDLEGQSRGHPDWETRVHVTKEQGAWPSIRVFFLIESEDKYVFLDAEEA